MALRKIETTTKSISKSHGDIGEQENVTYLAGTWFSSTLLLVSSNRSAFANFKDHATPSKGLLSPSPNLSKVPVGGRVATYERQCYPRDRRSCMTPGRHSAYLVHSDHCKHQE